MISSALQRAVVRTLMGLLAEHGIFSVEEDDLVATIVNAKLTFDPEECRAAIKYLKQADIIQNGRGTKLNLSGTGLTLGGTVAVPAEVGAALKEAINQVFGVRRNGEVAPPLSV